MMKITTANISINKSCKNYDTGNKLQNSFNNKPVIKKVIFRKFNEFYETFSFEKQRVTTFEINVAKMTLKYR